MDDDLNKVLSQFDYSIPFNVVPELFVRLLKVESRVEAVYSLFADVASSALHKDEESCEHQLDEIEKEIFNEKMTAFIGRFGQIPDNSKPSEESRQSQSGAPQNFHRLRLRITSVSTALPLFAPEAHPPSAEIWLG